MILERLAWFSIIFEGCRERFACQGVIFDGCLERFRGGRGTYSWILKRFACQGVIFDGCLKLFVVAGRLTAGFSIVFHGLASFLRDVSKFCMSGHHF